MVVSALQGSSWGYQPIPEHIPFGLLLTENGSDIVFWHSGHISRGIEIYRRWPVLYSTGDFVDDYAVDKIERNDESFIFVVETSSYRVTGLRFYPTVICHMKPGAHVPAMKPLSQRECRDAVQNSARVPGGWKRSTVLRFQ